MATRGSKRKSQEELLAMVEDMAGPTNADGAANAAGSRLKAIEFLLENGEQGGGNVEQVWDELFLIGEEEE